MASVNEGFVGDDDVKEKGELDPQISPLPSKVVDIIGVEIDYSAARKAPLFIAAISGKSSSVLFLRPLIWICLLTSTATWGAYILGTFIGWSSPVQPQLQHVVNATVPAHVTDPESIWYMDLDNTQMALVGSFVNLGALFGALMGGFLMDRFGRKLVLIVMSLPFVIGWLLIILAVDPSKFNLRTMILLVDISALFCP